MRLDGCGERYVGPYPTTKSYKSVNKWRQGTEASARTEAGARVWVARIVFYRLERRPLRPDYAIEKQRVRRPRKLHPQILRPEGVADHQAIVCESHTITIVCHQSEFDVPPNR